MRILVASDLTARSDRALARGFLLARERNADLRVIYVVDADLPADFKAHSIEWARAAMARETEKLAAATGKKAVLDVVAGDPRADIVRAASADETDLLVLGVHRGGDRAKPFAEATAGKVLKSSLTAALLVKGDAHGPYRDVVVGVDFTMFSRAALRQAAALAPSARLHLVHAFQVPYRGLIGSESFVSEVTYAQRLELDAFLKDEMELLERSARATCATAKIAKIIREGAPQEVLRTVCTEVSADLAVIGTHSRAGLSRAIWGSVAADLLDDPPCDVLVIKPF